MAHQTGIHGPLDSCRLGWTEAGMEPSFLSRMGRTAHLTLASDFFPFPL
uniref:Twinfilin actin binding protein 2 n=1 Tax=Mus musculus TaxID=10090 RepID=A0A087WPT3_MOUSE